MNWIIFALLAPFLWGVGSIITKFMRIKYIKSPLGYLVFISPIAFLSLILLVFEPFRNPGLINIIISVLSGIIAMVSYYLYICALHEEDASRAAILYGTTPLFALLLATIFLKEMLSLKDYIAFFLILGGTFLISIKNKKNKFKISKSILLIILSSFIGAVHNTLLKFATATNFSTMMVLRQSGIFLFVLLIFIFSKSVRMNAKETLKKFKIKRGILAYASESLGIVGMVFLYLAIQRAPVSLVTLVGGFQSLFVIFIAVTLSIFFPKIIRETIDKKTIAIKIVSALLMLLGLYIITI